MSFWDLFKADTPQSDTKKHSSLYYEIEKVLPNYSEEEKIKIACIAGLFARVAYSDLEISSEEVDSIVQALCSWMHLNRDLSQIIANLATNKVKELGSLENHSYVHHLKPLLNSEERYELVQALFALAASDGIVENVESEEIRIIVKGFDLSGKHFSAARAEVADKLGSLRK